jgi:hypothetical protein
MRAVYIYYIPASSSSSFHILIAQVYLLRTTEISEGVLAYLLAKKEEASGGNFTQNNKKMMMKFIIECH